MHEFKLDVIRHRDSVIMEAAARRPGTSALGAELEDSR
jgi:hypothetical protein